MKKESKTVVYDETLRIEAYRFEGIVQPFPNHFHAHYVLGLVEQGQRMLSCKNREFLLQPGDILLFNPGDNHACIQSDDGTLDYRGLNLSQEVMLDLVAELTGTRQLPEFSPTVIHDEEAACGLRSLHEQVMHGSREFGKEEALLLLFSTLIQQYSQPFPCCIPACPEEIEKACRFMEQHVTEHLSLEQICHHVGLSKSTLFRAFAKAKGITPYQYLENIRIGNARALLEHGVPPIEAALQTGFSDQSHFTRTFSRFIGLAPGVYREIFETKHPSEDMTHGI